MNINIGTIEEDFEYIDPEVFRNQIPSSKIRPGFHVDNFIYDKYTKIVELKKKQGHELREGDLFREIVTRFALGHFKNKQTVNRDIYENTVSENDKLTATVKQLTDIINKHDLTPKSQVSANRSSESWPTNTPPQNERYANPYANQFANGYAQQPANNPAVNYANGSAVHPANVSAVYPAVHPANVSAVNPANMANIQQREAAFALLFPSFAEYIQMLDIDINIQQLAIWLRYRNGLQ